MKRLAAIVAVLALLAPAAALAQIHMDEKRHGESRLVVFSVHADMPEAAPGKTAPVDPVRMAMEMQIEARFEQEKALAAADRAGAHIVQEGSVYQDERMVSMARTWNGEQADGTDGSSAAALTLNLETGMEIYLDELFDDPQAAFVHMENIIEDEILDTMSDYMEYCDLLPMPQNSYSVNELGLTVYWPQDRYRYFSEECGSVTFLWHEIADYIPESSPVYALSRPQEMNVSRIRGALALGRFDGVLNVKIGMELGRVKSEALLADPDYTTDALVYPLERVRGFAVEIPKYAETQEDETPVSAIRASSISYHGLTTGKTEMAEVYWIFGEPAASRVYDEDAAADALLEPGESLFFEEMDRVLQAHFDEEGVLSCLILRNALPLM